MVRTSRAVRFAAWYATAGLRNRACTMHSPPRAVRLSWVEPRGLAGTATRHATCHLRHQSYHPHRHPCRCPRHLRRHRRVRRRHRQHRRYRHRLRRCRRFMWPTPTKSARRLATIALALLSGAAPSALALSIALRHRGAWLSATRRRSHQTAWLGAWLAMLPVPPASCQVWMAVWVAVVYTTMAWVPRHHHRRRRHRARAHARTISSRAALVGPGTRRASPSFAMTRSGERAPLPCAPSPPRCHILHRRHCRRRHRRRRSRRRQGQARRLRAG